MTDRKAFFAAVRAPLFGGALQQSAVDTINAVLDEWERRQLTDLRWLAYMLATILGECGRDFHPVREGFKQTDLQARAYVKSKGYAYSVVVNGWVYYGRGLVQLTWLANYEKMAKALGLDLVRYPDLALVLANAVQIMFEGMLKAETAIGDFTGKSLEMYFNAKVDDPVGARRIINGQDRAGEIAGYHRRFLAALNVAQGAPEKPGLPAPRTPATKQPAPVPAPAPAQSLPERANGFFETINRMFGWR